MPPAFQEKTFPQFCKHNGVVGIEFLKAGTVQTAVVIVLCEGHLNKQPSALQVQPNILVMVRIIMEVTVK